RRAALRTSGCGAPPWPAAARARARAYPSFATCRKRLARRLLRYASAAGAASWLAVRREARGAVMSANAEAIGAWNTVLFQNWERFRDVLAGAYAHHGEMALRRHPPAPGTRVLDIGCGYGDTTLRIAELVGPSGEAVGVD